MNQMEATYASISEVVMCRRYCGDVNRCARGVGAHAKRAFGDRAAVAESATATERPAIKAAGDEGRPRRSRETPGEIRRKNSHGGRRSGPRPRPALVHD